MPIGTGIIYNVGDLILSQVSGSGTAFLETKIAAATSSIVYFDSTARINSASLNSITVGTASYVSGSTSIITNLTASNISASGTSSFGYVGIGTSSPEAILQVANTGRILGVLRLQITPQTTFYDHTFAIGTDGGGAQGFIYTSGTGGTFPLNTYGELILQAGPRTGFNNGISLVTGTTSPSVKLRIAEDGNVGIGTTSPSGIFHAANIKTLGTTADNFHGYFSSVNRNCNVYILAKNTEGSYLYFGDGDSNTVGALVYEHSANYLRVDVNGSERMRIVSDGNVGIGTTTVGNKLTVVTSTQYDGYYLRNVNGVVGTMLGVSATNDDGTVGLYSSTILKTNITANGASYFNGGNVGIGTTSPSTQLDIRSTAFTPSSTLGTLMVEDKSTWSQAIQFYLNNAGTYNSSRPSGAIGAANNNVIWITGGSFISNNPVGSLGFTATSTEASSYVVGAGYHKWYTNSGLTAGNTFTATERYSIDNTGVSTWSVAGSTAMTLNSTGLGIGTTAPGALFEISSSTVASLLNVKGAGGNGLLFVSGSGNVGIGTSSPAYKLDVNGSVNLTGNINFTGTGEFYLQNAASTNFIGINTTSNYIRFATNNSIKVFIDSAGNLGIGTSSPADKLDVNGAVYIRGSNSLKLDNASNNYVAQIYNDGSSGTSTLVFNTGGSEKMRIINGGNVGIGTTSPAYKLEVSGSFAATTKSFIIEHPIKSGKKLIYGSLESPYHGIRLTGRDTLKECKCKVELPDYIYKLILHDSVNIQLTGIKCNKTLYIDDINIPENYFTIAYDKTVFESYKDYDFFWDFTAIRADVPELQTEM